MIGNDHHWLQNISALNKFGVDKAIVGKTVFETVMTENGRYHCIGGMRVCGSEQPHQDSAALRGIFMSVPWCINGMDYSQ